MFCLILDTVMDQIDHCVFCHQTLDGEIVTLTSKGCEGILRASEKRDYLIQTTPGQQVHQICRKTYCNSKALAMANKKRKLDSTAEQSVLRSGDSSFNYKEHCIFCGNPDTFDHRKNVKGHKLLKVRTDEFHSEIVNNWSGTVKGRLNSVHDLFAADAAYHQICSVNFRTNKSIPRQFAPEEFPQAKRGRPPDSAQTEAFLKVTEYLEANDDEQTTISDLIDKMKEYLSDSNCTPYQFRYMKDQLKAHFGDKIVITEINGQKNVVTLRSTASSILHDFYCEAKQDVVSDKLRIIETAAKLIKSAIQDVIQTNESYASYHELSSVDESMAFLPESLKLLLRLLFRSNDKDVKQASRFAVRIQKLQSLYAVPL
jgi:hypothetical protein